MAGGGVFIDGAGTVVTFNNVKIKDNTAGISASAGAGIAVVNDGASLYINNSVIEGNTSGAGSAGGIYLSNALSCAIKNTLFDNNDASSGGANFSWWYSCSYFFLLYLF